MFFRAMSLAPAINLAIERGRGALPEKRMFITCRSEEQIGVRSGMVAASSRFCTRKPEGPAAMSLGKEYRMDRM